MSAGEDLDLRATRDGVTLSIHVTPRARQERVGGAHGDALRVAVTAAPIEGAANEACRQALARALGVSRSAVRIAPAAKHRRKRVEIEGDPGALERRLRSLAAPGSSD